MNKSKYEKLLEQKERENELLKEKADIFDEIRSDEFNSAKRSLGRLWDDSMTKLSIPALQKLVKNYGRRS